MDPRTRFRLLVAAGREGPSLDFVTLPLSAWCLEAGVGGTNGALPTSVGEGSLMAL